MHSKMTVNSVRSYYSIRRSGQVLHCPSGVMDRTNRSQASTLLEKGKKGSSEGQIKHQSRDDMTELRRTQSAVAGGCLHSCIRAVKGDAMIVATLVAVVLGVSFGVILKQLEPSEDVLTWIGLPGEVFLRCLNATIVPLIVCMVITSSASLQPSSNGKIAMVGFISIVLSHFIAAVLAIIMFLIFKPDKIDVVDDSSPSFDTDLKTQDVFADLIRNIFPNNVVSVAFSQTSTKYTTETLERRVENMSAPLNYSTVTETVTKKEVGTAGGTNILGLIVICSAVGLASNKVLTEDCEFLRFFAQGQKVTFAIIHWIFWLTPVGVASLIAKSMAEVEDIVSVFQRLSLLIGAVSSGLFVHQMMIWPLVLFAVTRENPFKVLSRCMKAFLVAFSATATSVALPEMQTACDMCKVKRSVSSFLLPMTVTVQADGSALFITSSVLFIAQLSTGNVEFQDFFVAGTMTTVLSCAIPPVPSSSIVTIVIVLTSLSIPHQHVALLFAAEWLLDRLRSGVNAVSHVLVCIITDKIATVKTPIPPDDHSLEYSIDVENVTSHL